MASCHQSIWIRLVRDMREDILRLAAVQPFSASYPLMHCEPKACSNICASWSEPRSLMLLCSCLSLVDRCLRILPGDKVQALWYLGNFLNPSQLRGSHSSLLLLLSFPLSLFLFSRQLQMPPVQHFLYWIVTVNSFVVPNKIVNGLSIGTIYISLLFNDLEI